MLIALDFIQTALGHQFRRSKPFLERDTKEQEPDARRGRSRRTVGAKQMTAIARFRTEFRRWVQSHNAAKGYGTDAEKLLRTLEARVGKTALTRIGSAYLNG
jgi:hypothetical protein